MFGDRGNWKLYLWMMLEEGHSSSALEGKYLLDTFCTTTVMIPPMNPVAWKTPTTALTQVTHEGIILNYLLCLSTHFLHGVTSCALEAVLWLLWGTDCAFWSWQILCANVCYTLHLLATELSSQQTHRALRWHLGLPCHLPHLGSLCLLARLCWLLLPDPGRYDSQKERAGLASSTSSDLFSLGRAASFSAGGNFKALQPQVLVEWVRAGMQVAKLRARGITKLPSTPAGIGANFASGNFPSKSVLTSPKVGGKRCVVSSPGLPSGSLRPLWKGWPF